MTLQGVLKCYPYLRAIAKTRSAKRRREILQKCPRKCIYYAICEIIKNVLDGNIHISQVELARLRRYKGLLRELSKKTIPLKKREALINQKGGFLPSLLFYTLPILASQL